MSTRNKKDSYEQSNNHTSTSEGPETQKTSFADLLRNCIDIKIGGDADKNDLTHFGGLPLLPKDFAWPYFETDSINDPDDGVKLRPLSFLAQFDCREFVDCDRDNLLPHTGILCFFYSVESFRWGFSPEDAGCSKVYWFEDINELEATPFPDDLAENFRFPALSISLCAKDCYPSPENLPENYDTDEYEEFFEELNIEESENVSKLLGWADVIQDTMETQCELIERGYNLGNSWDNIPSAVLDEVKRTSQEKWLLLFQLDTVQSDDFELMFGDCGKIYFWIRKDDLAMCRFDRVWLILQC